ncbi:MAG: CocE/NonD family hydrolase, partial [Myxococcales bacterium]|nr:CocE/NonD family hydrolase [Myxococcales bacterium]
RARADADADADADVEGPTGTATDAATDAAARAPTRRANEDGDDGPEALAELIKQRYDKRELRIPMRDGVELFTVVYAPKDRARVYPIMLRRTPYSVSPYGPDELMEKLGPSPLFAEDGYIFVYQDVRGKFMSGGEFVDMRPQLTEPRGPKDIDESTDTHDTITWLLANVEGHNGRVGMWGISYPGFYAAAGMINAHPALKAVSPQAPIADWYFDDFHHHGAFFLPHTFNFFARFGQPRPEPTTEWAEKFDHKTPDGYQFFLDIGPLRELDARFLHGQVRFWTDVTQHPDRDAYWQARDLLPHLQGVAPAVMTVGGLFDAEDLYGPLHVYRAIEERNPDVFNILVMGPWNHGGWGRTLGDHLGNISFGAETSRYYQKDIELVFFQHYLKGEPAPAGPPKLPEALVFNTGADAWREFDAWPPPGVEPRALYLAGDGALQEAVPPPRGQDHDAYVSDPARPVPFSEDLDVGMTREYMTDDQRFAARRPDVLVYQTPPLTEELTVAGPLRAELWVSTTAGDADWIVKLIDVFPPDAAHEDEALVKARAAEDGFVYRPLGGYQMMVRSEVLRGRYRDDYARPERFTPNQPTRVTVPLQDVLHTFKPGHRVMIQIQSTWFPLVDRNPQRYVPNIFAADEDDFVAATHRVYRAGARASRLSFSALRP